MKDKQALCTYCGKKTCFKGDLSNAPEFCPSINYSSLLDQAKKNFDIRFIIRLKMPYITLHQRPASTIYTSWIWILIKKLC